MTWSDDLWRFACGDVLYQLTTIPIHCRDDMFVTIPISWSNQNHHQRARWHLKSRTHPHCTLPLTAIVRHCFVGTRRLRWRDIFVFQWRSPSLDSNISYHFLNFLAFSSTSCLFLEFIAHAFHGSVLMQEIISVLMQEIISNFRNPRLWAVVVSAGRIWSFLPQSFNLIFLGRESGRLQNQCAITIIIFAVAIIIGVLFSSRIIILCILRVFGILSFRLT